MLLSGKSSKINTSFYAACKTCNYSYVDRNGLIQVIDGSNNIKKPIGQTIEPLGRTTS